MVPWRNNNARVKADTITTYLALSGVVQGTDRYAFCTYLLKSMREKARNNIMANKMRRARCIHKTTDTHSLHSGYQPPDDLNIQPRPPPRPPPPPPPPLWERHVYVDLTSRCSRYYYFNAATKVSQWELPGCSTALCRCLCGCRRLRAYATL